MTNLRVSDYAKLLRKVSNSGHEYNYCASSIGNFITVFLVLLLLRHLLRLLLRLPLRLFRVVVSVLDTIDSWKLRSCHYNRASNPNSYYVPSVVRNRDASIDRSASADTNPPSGSDSNGLILSPE